MSRQKEILQNVPFMDLVQPALEKRAGDFAFFTLVKAVDLLSGFTEQEKFAVLTGYIILAEDPDSYEEVKNIRTQLATSFALKQSDFDLLADRSEIDPSRFYAALNQLQDPFTIMTSYVQTLSGYKLTEEDPIYLQTLIWLYEQLTNPDNDTKLFSDLARDQLPRSLWSTADINNSNDKQRVDTQALRLKKLAKRLLDLKLITGEKFNRANLKKSTIHQRLQTLTNEARQNGEAISMRRLGNEVGLRRTQLSRYMTTVQTNGDVRKGIREETSNLLNAISAILDEVSLDDPQKRVSIKLSDIVKALNNTGYSYDRKYISALCRTYAARLKLPPEKRRKS